MRLSTTRSPRCSPLGSWLVLVFPLLLPTGASSQITADAFESMKARSIGPAGMSGRVAAVDVNPSNPNVIFVGAATGGVWRSVDGGIQWEPVFDDQPVLGIGSVAVFPGNPDVVWVGTGEGNPRNSAGVGAGIYRSLDGGDTWRFMGLGNSERIHRVIPHPSEPDVVFAGVLGPAWSDGEERGVYRTRDGGESWERVLFGNRRTGAADLAMDPSNPDKLIAALWEFRRWPWHFESGGPGSGLFITYDGGDTWRRMTPEDGLPEGQLGRTGLAFAPSNPEVVYALMEAEKNALLRSDNGGGTWTAVNDERGVNPRPFYYADIRVDPLNENRIYRLASSIDVSDDGGKQFRTVVPSRIIHGDVHELWIHPANPRTLIMGNDGGVAFSYDRGQSWRFVENLPLAQFYHISLDMEVPFNVYGGLQDNGSWFGPAAVWAQNGIMNAHWTRVGGGDGFATLTDVSDHRFGYSMSQQGNLMRFDKITGERRSIQPVHPEGERLRFNWNAALNVDPHDSTTIYLGSQFVHRTRDGGLSWEIISPDLTTNDPEKQKQDQSGGLTLDATGAENHTTILSIAPSSLEEGVIWVTTDDGNVQITRDDGQTWTNLGARIRGIPDATWAPHVEPSKHRPGRAYVVFDDHRRGNWTPYVFRTEDYGESWEALASDQIPGFVHVLEEDPEEPDLLFVGTEFGMAVSLNGGASWIPWRHGLPAVPVRALVVHPRDADLVLGTHGRAVFVLDDVRPLREMAQDSSLAAKTLHLFDPPPAIQAVEAERIGYRSIGHAMFFGENRPSGALLSFWVGGDAPSSNAFVKILDADGGVVRTLSYQPRRGLNRVTWDLLKEAPGGGGGFFGSQDIPVLPGVFSVRVTVAGDSVEAPLSVLPDPRVQIPEARRLAKIRALERARDWADLSREAQDRLEEAVRGVDQALETLSSEGQEDELRGAGVDLKEVLEAILRELFTGPDCQGICGGRTPASTVLRPLALLGSTLDAPSANDRLAMEQARTALRAIVDRVNRVFEEDVAPFRSALLGIGFTPFPAKEPLRMIGGDR